MEIRMDRYHSRPLGGWGGVRQRELEPGLGRGRTMPPQGQGFPTSPPSPALAGLRLLSRLVSDGPSCPLGTSSSPHK